MTDTPFQIAFIPYPNMTQLDMTGPVQVLGRMPGAKLHFVWKSPDLVYDDLGLGFSPTTTFADCPHVDMICVPGGYGCAAVMEDNEVLDWLRERDGDCRFVTSVCTGSLILAAAGLLQGRKAATHWAWREQLRLFGAEPTGERVVKDGKYITGGGVTAGIDFAFAVIEEMFGQEMAEIIQLSLEYDPAPVGGGTPETARPDILARAEQAMAARGMGDRIAEIEAIAAAKALR